MIPTIDLGHGLQVSQIGFGAMSLGGAYGRADHDESIATLNRAIDLGVTFIDTANVYGQPKEGVTGPAGTNEELIAEVLKTRRNEVQIATKFGITGLRQGNSSAVRGDRDYVLQCCDDSLRRLGVDTIDLYYMHRRELDRPIEETVAAMAELVTAGKVRHLGLSEVTGPELRAATSIHPITAVQTEYSLWSRDVEANVIPTAAELGTGFVPYSPLGRGYLTGQMSRETASKGVLQGQERIDQNFDANQRVVEAVRAIANEVGATPAQVALAWLIAQGQAFGLPVVSIPGTRRAARVEENAGATEIELSADQKQRLDQIADLAIGARQLAFNGPGWTSAERE
ncbi:MAG TPA: aldo/keto reductase [Ilumatobacteraceae bacterium]|nr:aldo/keto reductase [Ilumatobacteraceae bacterium]